MNTPVKKPKYIYLHLTSIAEEFDGNKYLQRVSKQFPGTTIFVSGSMLQSKKYQQPANMKFLYNLKEVREALLTI